MNLSGINVLRQVRHVGLALSSLLILASQGTSTAGTSDPSHEVHIRLDPSLTEVDITLDATLHTVHGQFRLKSGEISFEARSGNAQGAIVVDAASGNTENTSRDKKMHEEVLESKKFPEIVFLPTHVSGEIPTNGTSQVRVDGVMRIHGQEHPLSLVVDVDAPSRNQLHAKTHTSIPYQKWGMKNPSNFFLHVGDIVEIEINAAGEVSSLLAVSSTSAIH